MKFPAILVALCVVGFPIGTSAKEDSIRVHVESVYDGDTFTISDRLIPDLDLKWHIRIRGIDTPEIHARCDTERAIALAAKKKLETMLSESREVVLTDIEHDKYGGRLVATVSLLDGTRVSDVLIGDALAHSYDGGTKVTWCN